MFAIILVIMQFLILTFIGGFARTTLAFTTSSYFLGTNILFLLTWTLMNAPFKKLTLHALTILLLTFAFTFECNLLFGRFWYAIFNQFTTTYEITVEFIVESSIACFVVLLIMIDYIGIFRYWQIYMLLVPIINFGWSFNYAVLRYGLKIFDGGMANGFLYAGVVSIVVWLLSVRAKHGKFGGYDKNGNDVMRPEIYNRQEYYNGYSISLLGGLLGTFYLWPSVNTSISLMSGSLVTVNQTIMNSSLFQNTAYSNTFLCLCVGTVSSFILLNRDRIGERKHKIRCTIDCFINAGIICAYFVDISLNPAAVMAMALISTILTLVLYLYYQSLQSDSNKLEQVSSFMILILYYARALFRIVLPLLGSIVAAIVVANRQYSTYPLLNTTTYGTDIYTKTSGLEVAGYFVTLGVSIVGGVLSGLGVNLFLYVKENYPDQVKAENQKKTAESRLENKPKQNQLAVQTHINPYKSGLSLENAPDQLVRSKNIYRSKHLTDLDFLELDQNGADIFPLFLRPEDKYVDQQETARKLLKEAILSHVKSNYISTKNYISITKNNNVNTNNTANPDSQFETKPNPRRKLQFNLEGEHTLKNNISKHSTRREYANNMEPNSPKSTRSKIKNQSKEIEEQNKSSRFQKTNSDREAMPEFYVNHMKREKSLRKLKEDQPSSSSKIGAQVKEMNRSKTQAFLAYEPEPKVIKSNINKVSEKNIKPPEQPAIQRKSSLIPQIKKTESLNPAQNNQPSSNISKFSIISELQKEQQDQKLNSVANRMSSRAEQIPIINKVEEQKEIQQSGSFILDENQHIQDSQYI